MDHTFCPGAKFLRQPRPEIFECPDCGEEVEIWSDEIRGTCSACGRNVFREGLPSCVEWCKYGKECVGEEAYGTYQRNRALGLKRRLLEVLKRNELLDAKGAGIRERALVWAETILAKEPAAWHLVIPAVLVHHISFREQTGQGSLERLLQAQGLNPDDVRAVREILDDLARNGSAPEGLEARIVLDAWILAELTGEAVQPQRQPLQERPAVDQEVREREVRERLSTATAKSLSRERVVVGPGAAAGPSAASTSAPEKMEDADA